MSHCAKYVRKKSLCRWWKSNPFSTSQAMSIWWKISVQQTIHLPYSIILKPNKWNVNILWLIVQKCFDFLKIVNCRYNTIQQFFDIPIGYRRYKDEYGIKVFLVSILKVVINKKWNKILIQSMIYIPFVFFWINFTKQKSKTYCLMFTYKICAILIFS